MGGMVGVTSPVAVSGSGVAVGETGGTVKSCGVFELAGWRLGEAEGSGCENTRVAEAETAGVFVLWQALASQARVSRLATRWLVMLKNRLGIFLERLEKWSMD
jgi:hypothetical protein